MAMIKGITVVLVENVKTGEDPFHAPIYKEVRSEVKNVLVSPASYKGNIYAVTKGKTAMRDLILEEGDNELCFKGKGIVSVEYRGGSL